MIPQNTIWVIMLTKRNGHFSFLWQNMMTLLRKRTKFSEPEARVYMTQLISAVMYMHEARVMHRDLKLGNVFVMDKGSKGLCCKVGDFGLAALLDKDSDRRK